MNAVILAGGKGSRMKGQRVPKPLVKIKDSVTLIDHVIRQLLRSGAVRDLIISLGHHSAEIRKHLESYPKHLRDRFQYVYEKKELGTGGALQRALCRVNNAHAPVFVVNGDIVSDIDPSALLAQHQIFERETSCAATIAAVSVRDGSGLGSIYHDPKTQKIQLFCEKTGKQSPALVNAGWYVMSKEAFGHYIVNPNDTFSLERDVFPTLAAAGHLRLYFHRGVWANVTDIETLKKIRLKYIETRI